jgi:hypothetical protein
MQAAESLLYTAIDVLVVEASAFPAHAADQSDGFHRARFGPYAACSYSDM